ncbi:hypothetical protein DFJ74DRAFT_116189 [Hyaloraphidium curvatum]|nr:hypothetical protein DFJ74DRAFT_116189 [Hyaloraphidium curvatum]
MGRRQEEADAAADVQQEGQPADAQPDETPAEETLADETPGEDTPQDAPAEGEETAPDDAAEGDAAPAEAESSALATAPATTLDFSSATALLATSTHRASSHRTTPAALQSSSAELATTAEELATSSVEGLATSTVDAIPTSDLATSTAELLATLAASTETPTPTPIPVFATSHVRHTTTHRTSRRKHTFLHTTSVVLTVATANAISLTSQVLSSPTPLIGGGSVSASDGDDDDDDTPTPTPKASPFLIPHAVMSLVAFFVIFPLGMAIARRYRVAHIVFQVVGAIIGIIGVFLGKLGWTGTSWRDGKIQIVISAKYDLSTRLHKGLGWGILTLVVLQSGVLGALKMLIVRWQKTGWSAHIRWYRGLKKVVGEMHKANAWVILGAAYIESAVGVTSLSGTCLWDGVGGCLGHIIAGSALVWYSAFFLLRLLHPQPDRSPNARSEEFYACLFILGTGIAALISSILTRDPPFSHSLLFVAGGVLGITVEASKVFKGRNPVPGLIILTLGFAAAFSTNVDPFSAAENDYSAVILLYVGYALAAGGLFRIVEVAVRKPPAVIYAEEDEEFGNPGPAQAAAPPMTNVLNTGSEGAIGASSSQTINEDDEDSDLDEDVGHPGFTADMDPSTSAMANAGLGGANGTKPNSRPGSVRSQSRLVKPSGRPRRRRPPPIVRWESVPAFLSLFFIFIAGTLFIGSSSGAPPRWAWLADVDSIGYAEIYVAAAMICMAWVVLVGAIAQRMRKQMSEELLEREEEEDEEDYSAQYQGLGSDLEGFTGATSLGGPGGSRSRREELEMDNFLGDD